MRMKKIVLGLSAAAAVVALAACSSGSGDPQVVAAANAGGLPNNTTAANTTTSTSDPTTSTTTTTAPPATTTTPKHATPAVAPAAPQSAAAPGVPCSAAARACVSLSTHKAWLVQNGAVVFGPVSIMPGSRRYPTPAGTFHVLFKNANYRSKEFDNAPMPDAVFFYPGDAFHVGSLGVYSHGCIHLSWNSAGMFFKFLQVGDEVQILP